MNDTLKIIYGRPALKGAPYELELYVPDNEKSSIDPEISIVIPALNEQITIGEFIEWCWEGLYGWYFKKISLHRWVLRDIAALSGLFSILFIFRFFQFIFLRSLPYLHFRVFHVAGYGHGITGAKSNFPV
jgi:hypothetical protein